MNAGGLHAAYDELLVLAWQQGFAPAGERLVSRWYPRLWRHARLLTDSADDATDATQAAWASMIRTRGSLRHPSRFGPWAYRIVTRRCADAVRRRQRDRRVTAAHDGRVDPPVARPREPDDRTPALRAALESLGGEERAMLMLVHVDGLPLKVVAEIFGIPVGTAKSRLHATRRTLRTWIEDDHAPS